MTPNQILQTVDALQNARLNASPIGKLSTRYLDMSVDDAYAIQRKIIEQRTTKGVRLIGRKIGLTSRAAQQMLKVAEPDFGCLLSDMALPSGAQISRASLIAPKAEGEIAFVMRKDLKGPGVTAADVLAATEGVMACFEIVDSRIEKWDIGLQDTVADNASSALFVLGDRLVNPRDIDLALTGMVLEKNGEIVLTGAGAAALGSPVNAVVWLVNMLGKYGEGLSAGDVVLSGSLAAMVAVEAGDHLRVTIGGIGSCAVRFV